MADNIRLLKNLFAVMEEPLFLGDGLSQGEFHALMQPGQFVSTNLRESDSSDDMQIQASLTDLLLDSRFIYTTLTGTVSEQYRFLLDSAALPYVPTSAADQAEIDAANRWLSNAKTTYDTFGRYYRDAAQAYQQEANSQTPNGARLTALRQQMDEAYSDWETMGQKSRYESTKARVIYLSSGDPAAMWNDFKNTLRFHDKTAPHRGRYLQTFLIPAVATWNSADMSWSQFEKKINESDTYNYSSSTSWGGGGSVGWGLFSAGGSASSSSSYSHSESDVTTVSIKFDYARVRIDRPWLVSDIFGYRFWWWKKAFGYRLLSDGGNLAVTPPQRPVGIFPFLPNYLIIVRNLEIISNFSHNDATTISNSISGSASAGWGPFSVNGSYAEANTTQITHASFDGTTIRVSQPQIIGYSGTLLPLSPNPDRTLPWQDDHAPFDPPKEHVASLKAARRSEYLDYKQSNAESDLREAALLQFYSTLRSGYRAISQAREQEEANALAVGDSDDTVVT